MGCCNSKADDTKDNKLNTCAQHGYIEPLKDLIEENKEIDVQDKHKCTALFWAIMFDKTDIVQLLIDKSADIFCRDENEDTPFIKACSIRANRQILDKIVQQASSLGRLHDIINCKDKDGNTALLNSIVNNVHNEITEFLINVGSDLNAKDKFGNTPLLRAITFKNVETAKRLILMGAELHHKDQLGFTALTMSITYMGQNDTTLTESILSRHPDAQLINELTVSGQSALMAALDRNQDDIAQSLIRLGAVVDVVDAEGKTALMHAMCGKCWSTCRLLLGPGLAVDLEAMDKSGRTVLIHAIENESEELGEFTKILLERNVNLDFRDRAGDSPLMHAVKGEKERLARTLIKLGAQLSSSNNAGESVFLVAHTLGLRHVVSDAILHFQPVEEGGRLTRDAHCIWRSILSDTGDEYVEDLTSLLKELGPLLPKLLQSSDFDGRRCVELAPPKYRELLMRYAYFAGAFEFVTGPVCHESGSGSLICLAHLCLDDRLPLVALKFVVNNREISLRKELSSVLDSSLVLVPCDEYFPVNGDTTPCAYDRAQSPGGGVCVVRRISSGAVAGSSLIAGYKYCAVLPAGDFNLRQGLAREHRLGTDQRTLKAIAMQLTEAVRHLHSHRVVHGCIHPGHFVHINGRYVLVDLQACASFGSKKPKNCPYIAWYSPPELLPFLRGDIGTSELCVSPAHDVWSLGAIFFEVFTGRPLYTPSLQDRSDEHKSRRLADIEDPDARALLALMLSDITRDRPSLDQVYSNRFFQ